MIKTFKYGVDFDGEIFARVEQKSSVEEVVAEIIKTVKTDGDKAIFDYVEKFDKVKLNSLIVSEEEFLEAENLVEDDFKKVIQKSANNIRKFHTKQLRKGFKIKAKHGAYLGQKIVPIENVGLYVPGGTASYPSTVLMDAIPAKIAGCKSLAIATPPKKDGKINPYVLYTAKVAGVDIVYKTGGAQAIAGLAYGTESIQKVDKIVGPGNAFVAEAKKQVFGTVSIDMIAGPSEILVIADDSARADFVSADLLSQAEHDKMASAVLVTNSERLAKEVSLELERQIELLDRKEIARASIDNNGKIIIVDDILTAVEVSNEIAPEHLELCVTSPKVLLEKVKHAGSVFMGHYCPEALGDYLAGANHTLPTSGTARFSSPLSVDDFIKKTQFTYYTKKAFIGVANDIDLFARKEGLTAHAKSATIRLEDK